VPPVVRTMTFRCVISGGRLERSVLCFRAAVARTNWRGMQGEISSLFAGDP
jgi:hypothetical protein